MEKNLALILSELGGVLEQVDAAAQQRLARCLLDAKRVFVAGAGRSGMVARCFAMRLMHLGVTAFAVGEPTTPALCAGDVLLIASGSGGTPSLVGMAEKAVAVGASVALVTSRVESPIGRLAACSTVLHSPAKADRQDVAASVQPMATLFEQCLMLYLDSCVLQLMALTGCTAQEMYARHANLE